MKVIALNWTADRQSSRRFNRRSAQMPTKLLIKAHLSSNRSKTANWCKYLNTQRPIFEPDKIFTDMETSTQIQLPTTILIQPSTIEQKEEDHDPRKSYVLGTRGQHGVEQSKDLEGIAERYASRIVTSDQRRNGNKKTAG
ncbi:uncharacterized protein LOC143909161 [Arctopsyche grandis]|uniref:uncharacterized protein LOC143909161 n=1 Tax=Arctopsyche grandis TaxID=121162 RepID=UPI00406D9DF6